jgi:hypothetical protein
LAVGLAPSGAAFAHESHKKAQAADHSGHAKGQLVPADAKTDAAWLAKAQAGYPTEICVVSEDKLGGDMGKPQDFIYRAEGKPDRLVRFCCKDCVKDCNKDPDQYLKMLDAAAAKKGR